MNKIVRNVYLWHANPQRSIRGKIMFLEKFYLDMDIDEKQDRFLQFLKRYRAK